MGIIQQSIINLNNEEKANQQSRGRIMATVKELLDYMEANIG